MATHARIFYYNKRIGVSLDFARYQAWLAKHPEHHGPNVLPDAFFAPPEGGIASPWSPAPPLDWQQAAPRGDLFVDRSGGAGADARHDHDDQPAYPMGFAEMLKLIQEGKPVPGIRQIPNTVIRDPVSLPTTTPPIAID